MLNKGEKVKLQTNNKQLPKRLQQLHNKTGIIVKNLSQNIYVVKVNEGLYNVDAAYISIETNVKKNRSRAFSIRENKKISDTELLVMKCIWDIQEPCTCHELIEKIKSTYGLDYKETTVYTFLKNLNTKGVINAYKIKGRGITFYEASLSEKDYLKEFLNNTMDFWFKGEKAVFIKIINEVC